jgi:hypothetical protein
MAEAVQHGRQQPPVGLMKDHATEILALGALPEPKFTHRFS